MVSSGRVLIFSSGLQSYLLQLVLWFPLLFYFILFFEADICNQGEGYALIRRILEPHNSQKSDKESLILITDSLILILAKTEM